MVFAVAALAQAAGCGVAWAFYLEIHSGLPPWLLAPRAWSLGLTLLATAALRWPGRRVVSRESLLALLYLLGAAGALLLGTRITQEAHDVEAILFGSAVVVSALDVSVVVGVGGGIMLLLLAWYRGFWFASLDPDAARVRRLPVTLLDLIFLLMLAVFVSVTTRALGVLPVFAFSVLPAVAAIAVCRTPASTGMLACVLGVVAGAGGYFLAFVAAFPVGASQTLLAGAFVLLAFALRAAQGWWKLRPA
jgi:zinc transport system permease protein